MDLFEYQGKQYFARFGIPVSPGGVADTVDEAVAQAERVGYPVVVKSQGQVGGRGKAGGHQLVGGARPAASSWRARPPRSEHMPRRFWVWTSRATPSIACGSSAPRTLPTS